MFQDYQTIQRIICNKYNVEYFPSPLDKKIGISLNMKDDILPIHGLRHPPEGDTSGWYIWCGEDLTKDEDFFKPLHVKHLESWSPKIQKILGLPPGWRFLIADDYEDVWFDISLLEV